MTDEIGAAILLHHQPGTAAPKEMELDAARDQRRERWATCQPPAQSDHRIFPRSRAGCAAQIVLACRQDQPFALEDRAVAQAHLPPPRSCAPQGRSLPLRPPIWPAGGVHCPASAGRGPPPVPAGRQPRLSPVKRARRVTVRAEDEGVDAERPQACPPSSSSEIRRIAHRRSLSGVRSPAAASRRGQARSTAAVPPGPPPTISAAARRTAGRGRRG